MRQTQWSDGIVISNHGGQLLDGSIRNGVDDVHKLLAQFQKEIASTMDLWE